ncbi:MAG: NADP-dependent malic enzyme [Geminicoccaceae bacterium]
MSSESLKNAALEYHEQPFPGKLAIRPTTPLATQRDLSLAYSPGVAHACEAIVEDPANAAKMTARGNLVAVVTNGTAVLGLGPIGPLAAKPVMEGKSVLFKKFAGIDAFDIEIDETDPERLCDVIAALEPTFGAINLEDIKAPECFEVESTLRKRMNIPVFHDDQHGTAIIVAAAVQNGLHLVGKRIGEVRLVCCGAGAAALACLDLLTHIGVKREHITVVDIVGVVYDGRTELMDPYKARYARATELRTLAEAVAGADVFLGLSAGNLLTVDMVKTLADKPLILALANPTPEIDPDQAREARPDAIIATGRSDHPNQVNNVLCFPFIFRGALDAGATEINEAMKVACVSALAELARQGVPETVAKAYAQSVLSFGPDYIIPKPFDPRLQVELPAAVARAAAESGVAARPIIDLAAYRVRLSSFVYRSGLTMKPLFERARNAPQRIVYSDGEEERVLRAVQVVVDEGLAKPILIGRPEVIARRIQRFGLALEAGKDFELCDPGDDPRFDTYWRTYHDLMGRRGVTPEAAQYYVRTRPSVIAAIMLQRGEADAMIAGPVGRFGRHLDHVREVLGLRDDCHDLSTLHAIILDRGTLFMADTYVSYDPPADEIAQTAIVSAESVRRFGIEPKIALVSHSSFGTHDTESAIKMREVLKILRVRRPDLEVDGEMHADAAMNEEIRMRLLPDSALKGPANLLIMPNLDAANIAYNLAKVITGSVTIGPILIGPNKPAHIVTPSVTSRGLVNISAVAAVEALANREVVEAGSSAA